MDSTANEIEVPGVDIRGFPTILFFPGNKKDSPVPYEGAREVSISIQLCRQVMWLARF
jgi:protein disulfide-isomerase A1